MSYDEIDFAERLGEDDIDIDIDLETGQNDEDYILEDVNSDTGHGEAFIANDDVMIDDENVSYPMDDVDAIQEEYIEMQDADLSDMPATEFNNPGLNINLERNTPLLSIGVDEASETVIDGSQSHEEPLGDIEVESVPGGHALVEETVLPGKRTANADSTLSPPTSPQRDTGAQIGADSHILISEPAYSPSIGDDPGNQDPIGPVTTSGTSIVNGRTQDEFEFKTGNGDSILLAAEKVIVTYRDAEYALCSSFESDDPDTFFLKDVNLVSGSLADLMAGLREVIHEDLGSEDELCLAAEDLGIEISETCISVHDVNFASIIDLHQRLQRNDGVQNPRPLYVTLGTKPDFAKRLANLIAGATDGKGMSDLTSWDEESEDLDENARESEKLDVTDEHAEVQSASTKDHRNDLAGDGAKEEQVLKNVDSKQNTGSVAEGVEAQEDHIGKVMPKDHDQLTTSENIPSQAKVSEYSKDGLDEDGDFIDYEDEEYEQSRETSASANGDSSGKQYGNSSHFVTPCSGLASCTCPRCNKLPLIYDEDNKSGPDQHLPIPAPEEDGHQVQLDSYASTSPVHFDKYLDEQALRETDNEDGEISGYPGHNGYEGNEGSTLEQMGEELYVAYDGIQEEDEGKDGNIVANFITSNVEEDLDPLELDPQPEAIKPRHDDELEEIDYNATGQYSGSFEQKDDSIASAVENQRSKPIAPDGHYENDDEISYEEVDIPGSNESEHTLIADESAPDVNFEELKQEQNNDEINYDTDDQQDLNHSSDQRAGTEASPISNGQKGKRQRADAEDTTDRASKQPKRARS